MKKTLGLIVPAFLTTLTCLHAQAAGWQLTGYGNTSSYAAVCPNDEVVTLVACQGLYCWNTAIYCETPRSWDNFAVASLDDNDKYWTPYTNNYNYSSEPDRAVCSYGYAMVGIDNSWQYSFNFRVLCAKIQVQQGYRAANPPSWLDTVRSTSDTWSYEPNYYGGRGIRAGARCSGSNCDTMAISMTRIIIE